MPSIEVHLIENVLNTAQKRQIVQKLNGAMVSKVRTCAAWTQVAGGHE